VVSAVSSAVDTVEAEVPELVRRRGLDPVEDRLAMRRLIDDERALSSTMPALPDPRPAARAVYDAVAGFGPLQRHLDDPEVEEIWISDRVTGVGRHGRSTCGARIRPSERRRALRRPGLPGGRQLCRRPGGR
jgi:pilus assembly protein CpaF